MSRGYVYSTISKEQLGVYTFIDLELIDVSTCETASDLAEPSSVASSQPTKRDTHPLTLSSRVTLLNVRHGDPKPRNCIRQRHCYHSSAYTALDLISVVGPISPYSTNENTVNSVDQVFVLSFGSTILEYLYLGEDISDGLLPYEHNIRNYTGCCFNYDPSSIEAGNMAVNFPGGAGSDNSKSSDSDTTGNLAGGDESGESTSSGDNSTISISPSQGFAL
ncbi:hypothetical protein F5146DRAFT_1201712 [Armillaria mellea]|nr:hypothetical protein F5146DRAFT_1201712 [Armillaria mellea]